MMKKVNNVGCLVGRREFLVSGAGMVLVAGMGFGAECPAERPKRRLPRFKPLNLKRIRIEAGAARPFKAVHLSDTHIVRVDASEKDLRKMRLAATRYTHMSFGEHYLAEAVAAARREGALLLHTGDMIDFVSKANLDLVGRYYGSDDWFVASGNHEFSRYVGEAREDAAYKAGSFAQVQASYPNDLCFASRIVNGVNFVAVDDGYYNFTAGQLSMMEREVAKGLPIVLMCHVPLYTPRHYRHELAKTRGVCSYQTGVPDELVDSWRAPSRPLPADLNWRDRRVQQRADAPTREFIKYIRAQPLLKAILCGHCHEFWEERFSATAVQHVCSATYLGEGYAIDFV